MQKLIIVVVVLVALGTGAFAYMRWTREEPVPPAAPQKVETKKSEIIGRSVEGRAIEAFYFPARGTAKKKLLFVGGVHGGYEWNSVLLAYEFIDLFTENPAMIPAGVSVTIIPSLNPDGVFDVIGKEGRFSAVDVPEKAPDGTGRFNAHSVDLNRNFDCKWQPTSSWRGQTVSAGTKAFSEPEAATLRDFVAREKPDAAVFWHSQANAVYASECEKGILPLTRAVMNAYSKAAGYKAVDVFDAYSVTGDAEGWLASINIPAITVEMATHETIEWEKNLAGMKALFALYTQ